MPDPTPRAAQSTEAPDARHPRLDGYATPELVAAFVDDQVEAVAAVRAALPDIARAVDASLPRLQAGGRLIYVGAGTSGRLGVLDSVELGPTFDWPPERARALMAGGDPAMYVAVEGAEDDASQAAEDLHRLGPTEHDVVICLAASGTTPYRWIQTQFGWIDPPSPLRRRATAAPPPARRAPRSGRAPRAPACTPPAGSIQTAKDCYC